MNHIATTPAACYAAMPEALRAPAARIVDYLTKHPPATDDVICASLGIDAETFGMAIDQMEGLLIEPYTLYRPLQHVARMHQRKLRHAHGGLPSRPFDPSPIVYSGGETMTKGGVAPRPTPLPKEA